MMTCTAHGLLCLGLSPDCSGSAAEHAHAARAAAGLDPVTGRVPAFEMWAHLAGTGYHASTWCYSVAEGDRFVARMSADSRYEIDPRALANLERARAIEDAAARAM